MHRLPLCVIFAIVGCSVVVLRLVIVVGQVDGKGGPRGGAYGGAVEVE